MARPTRKCLGGAVLLAHMLWPFGLKCAQEALRRQFFLGYPRAMSLLIAPAQFAALSSLDDIYTVLHITGDKADATTPLGAVHAVLESPDFFMDFFMDVDGRRSASRKVNRSASRNSFAKRHRIPITPRVYQWPWPRLLRGSGPVGTSGTRRSPSWRRTNIQPFQAHPVPGSQGVTSS